jgi:hypothetical protein
MISITVMDVGHDNDKLYDNEEILNKTNKLLIGKWYEIIHIYIYMSSKLSFLEKTNLYLTNLNNNSKIDVLIPDGVLKCDESNENFYIDVKQFNTFHNFYHVIEGYNNNFNIILMIALILYVPYLQEI